MTINFQLTPCIIIDVLEGCDMKLDILKKIDQDLIAAKLKKNKIHFKDNETGKIYAIDCVKYIYDRNQYIEDYGLKNVTRFRNEVYLEKSLSEKRIQELDSFCTNRKFIIHKKLDSTILSHVKLMGEFLRNDEFAYLIPLIPFSDTEENRQKLVMGEKRYEKERIRSIYALLNEIVNDLVASDHYNFIPGTTEQGWSYYESKLFNIKKEINEKFLGEEDMILRFERIVDELEFFVKCYSTPGVVDRWAEINPTIMYFDAAYEIMSEERELYERIKNNPEGFSFRVYPTEKQLQKRQAYFEDIKRKNTYHNLQYSETQIFQNELVNTLKKVLEHDFPELKN